MYNPHDYPPFAVTVDVVALCPASDGLSTVLVKRSEEPFAGLYALPGTFVGQQEHLIDAARRVLREKAGITRTYLEQLYTMGAPDRDPRMRVVSVAYLALAPAYAPVAPAGLFLLRPTALGGRQPEVALAFDHAELIATALGRLRGKLDYTEVGFHLLPRTFSLRDAQSVWERMMDGPVNKDSFRRKLLATGLLEATEERQSEVEHRPAALYMLKKS